MRNAGLVAFSLTTCVLVPTAIHVVSAGQEQIAKLSAPSQDTIVVGKASVKASLDRYMLDPGDKLTVKLAATGIAGKNLEVGVLVLGANGSEGDRVPTPPNGVAFRILTLPAKDGVATGEMSFALTGAKQTRWLNFGHYTVLVGEPAAIRKLEHLRRSAHFLDTDDEIPSLNKAGNTFFGLYNGWAIEKDDTTSPYSEGKLARLEAHTRPKSDAIALTVPDSATVNHAFHVSLTVKNPGKRAMKGVEVTLIEQSTFSDFDIAPGPRLKIQPEKLAIDLAGHESRTIEFEVTSTEAGVIGLFANAACTYEAVDAKTCRDVQALAIGAFDATEVLPADTKAPAVVVR